MVVAGSKVTPQKGFHDADKIHICAGREQWDGDQGIRTLPSSLPLAEASDCAARA